MFSNRCCAGKNLPDFTSWLAEYIMGCVEASSFSLHHSAALRSKEDLFRINLFLTTAASGKFFLIYSQLYHSTIFIT